MVGAGEDRLRALRISDVPPSPLRSMMVCSGTLLDSCPRANSLTLFSSCVTSTLYPGTAESLPPSPCRSSSRGRTTACHAFSASPVPDFTDTTTWTGRGGRRWEGHSFTTSPLRLAGTTAASWRKSLKGASLFESSSSKEATRYPRPSAVWSSTAITFPAGSPGSDSVGAILWPTGLVKPALCKKKKIKKECRSYRLNCNADYIPNKSM